MPRLSRFLFAGLLSLIIVAAASAPAVATIYYVDAAKANNSGAGTSWVAAKRDLQEAIVAAQAGDSIWVRTGVYLPTRDAGGNTSPADPREKCFRLKDGVKVFGGFAGTETAFGQRSITMNITTLSGDIGTPNYIYDNCYHVVLAIATSPSCLLDGFVITRGFTANGGTTYVGSAQIGKANGAGIYCDSATSVFRSLVIDSNVATGQGGGMYNNASTITLSNTAITRNTGEAGGGGICNFAASPQVTDVLISHNTAQYHEGGGVFNLYNSNASYSSVIIRGNDGRYGGGVNNYLSDATFTEVLLDSNSTYGSGGGMYNYGSNPLLRRVVFSNDSSGSGGGMSNYGAVPVMINVVFVDNVAGGGGAIANENASGPYIVNGTFYGNRATYNGGAIYNAYTAFSMPTVINSVFWNNSDPAGLEIYNDFSSYLYAGTRNNASDKGGNSLMAAMPGFVSLQGLSAGKVFRRPALPAGPDGKWFTTDDGLQIIECAPVVDKGDTSSLLSTDILGRTRVSAFDIGAYEFVGIFPPVVSIYRSGDTLGTDSFSSYQWYVDSLPIAGGTSRYLPLTKDGVYTVVVTNGDSCAVLSGTYIVKGLGVSATALGEAVKIFPNPATDKVFISTAEPFAAAVLGMDGRVLIQGDNTPWLDLAALQPGIYCLRVTDRWGRLLRQVRLTKL